MTSAEVAPKSAAAVARPKQQKGAEKADAGPAPFPCPGRHNMKLMSVFWGDRMALFLFMVAVAPFWLFPMLFGLAWEGMIPIWPLEVVVVSTVLWPPLIWLLAARRKITTVWVWRRWGDTPVLSQEPWDRKAAAELPAEAANWRQEATAGWTWVIDAMGNETDEESNGRLARDFPVTRFNPPVAGASDEAVSLWARSEASEVFYTSPSSKDRYIGLKITGLMVLLAVVPFLTWLTISSLTKPPVTP